MRSILLTVWASALFIGQAVAANGSTHSLEMRKISVGFPIVGDPNIDKQCPSPERKDVSKIDIFRVTTRADDVYWNDFKIEKQNANEHFQEFLVTNGHTELQIYPDPNSRTETVFNVLENIIRVGFPCYGFVNNHLYQKISKPKAPVPAPQRKNDVKLKALPRSERKPIPIEIRVLLTDLNGHPLGDQEFAGPIEDGRCLAYFGSTPVDNVELIDSVKDALWTAVDKKGGVSNIQSGEITPEDLPNAMIVTARDTPWRCVGGVAYNLQVSGYASVDFVLMPDNEAADQ